MWIAKLKLKHADCPIVNRCEKFGLIVLSYPHSWHQKKVKKYATTTCFFQGGDDTSKKLFIKDMKKDKRISNIEVSGDIFTYEINLGDEGEHVMLYYKHPIFFVSPTMNHPDGHEYWEVASWKREELNAFVKLLQKHMDVCKIEKFENSPLRDVYFPNVMPNLTKNQKKAIELAYTHGYYKYPRKITLEKLAKMSGIGLSTFQEHLRKAELSLLPVIIELEMRKK